MTQFDQRYQQVDTQYNAGGDIHLHQPPLTLTEQQHQRNRAVMLDLVQSIWIDGVLEPSLHGASQIALELQHKPSAVMTPWWVVLREFEQTGPLLPTDTSIRQVYDQANGQLLILGEPGSGKTTLLLELARDLLERARHNESHPIPVVFTLSFWAMKRLPLSEWLEVELKPKYQIPRPLAASWIATDQILPLLDGLDEVAVTDRSGCVEAINAYRQAHGLLPMVVCSRQTDYFALPIRTLLRTAVVVQPLSSQQIETYLTGVGEPLEALRQALQKDTDLQVLVSTPLMLTILTLAYQGTPLSEIAPLGTLPAKQQHIFDIYVKRMLTRRGPLKAGTPQQVVQWLTFLASRMREHNQTVFSIELLQPSWLIGNWTHGCYRFSCKLFIVLLASLIVGSAGWLYYKLFYGTMTELSFDLWFFRLPMGIFLPLSYGLASLLPFGLVFGSTDEIKLIELPLHLRLHAFRWSWKKLLSRLSGFLRKVRKVAWEDLVAWLATILIILLVGMFTVPLVLLSVMLIVLVILLLGGLSRIQLPERIHYSPNEGIWHSVKNGLLGMLLGGLLGMLLGGLSCGPMGILLLGFPGGLFGGLLGGLDSFFSHFILRFWLWRLHQLPCNLVAFLDEEAERLLFRKVGGSYIFIHRLLLDYFASLEKKKDF